MKGKGIKTSKAVSKPVAEFYEIVAVRAAEIVGMGLYSDSALEVSEELLRRIDDMAWTVSTKEVKVR